VQLLFGFLLTVPFQARFATVGGGERALAVTALVLAALASAFLIGPVSYHRILFHRRMKDDVVRAANRMAKLGLACLALSIVSSVMLVLDVVIGRFWGAAGGGAIFLVLLVV